LSVLPAAFRLPVNTEGALDFEWKIVPDATYSQATEIIEPHDD
jgi:hypothetical protein